MNDNAVLKENPLVLTLSNDAVKHGCDSEVSLRIPGDRVEERVDVGTGEEHPRLLERTVHALDGHESGALAV